MINREQIKNEFEYYLSHIAKSPRRTADGFNLSPTAVGSYLSFLDTGKLFDYNPEKWNNIDSLYDITDPIQIRSIVDTLLSDNSFLERDNQNNQGWRSGAIMHYACFIEARSYFDKRKEENHSFAINSIDTVKEAFIKYLDNNSDIREVNLRDYVKDFEKQYNPIFVNDSDGTDSVFSIIDMHLMNKLKTEKINKDPSLTADLDPINWDPQKTNVGYRAWTTFRYYHRFLEILDNCRPVFLDLKKDENRDIVTSNSKDILEKFAEILGDEYFKIVE